MLQYVLMRLGEDEFGLDVSRVVRVVNPGKMKNVPEQPDFIF